MLTEQDITRTFPYVLVRVLTFITWPVPVIRDFGAPGRNREWREGVRQWRWRTGSRPAIPPDKKKPNGWAPQAAKARPGDIAAVELATDDAADP